MKSVMNYNFGEVPQVKVPRSTFDRSHGHKTCFDAGYLIPVYIDEVLPGDTFDLNMAAFARLATPTYPIMDNMILDSFFFFCPNRLVWNNFPKFCGEQTDPGDSTDYTIPVINDLNNESNESIVDYFGLPTKIAANIEVNALPFRAHNLIYNEWFRDQNLIDSLTVNKDDGPDSIADYELKRRGKRHDYFTSALPWLQKGDSVLLSLGTQAPVTGIGSSTTTFVAGPAASYETDASASTNYADYINPASTAAYIEEDPSNAGYPNIRADLTQAVGPTVNEFREAIQVQRMLERDARSGTRYIEILKSHFGVSSPDFRLQRPEYLGGGSSPVNVNAVARTDSSPGVLGAQATVAFKNHGFVKSFVEHGYVLGFVCVRADLTYQEGIERMWNKQTRYDLYWPTLAHLGEQEILNKEIYVDAATIGAGTDDDVFGYQERFAEYRYKKSIISGKLRSNDAASLDAWHLGIEFGTTPTLDESFIVENPPIDRVIATPTEPHFIFDSYFNLKCTRPMPIYSVPGLVDHF